MRWLRYVFCLLFIYPVSALTQSIWQDTPPPTAQARPTIEHQSLNELTRFNAKDYRALSADFLSIKSLLIPLSNGNSNTQIIDIPLPDGEMASYLFTYSPIGSQAFQDNNPDLLAFQGVDINKPNNVGRFDISPTGFRGFFHHNGMLVVIDPIYKNNLKQYGSYYAQNATPLNNLANKTYNKYNPIENMDTASDRIQNSLKYRGQSSLQLRTYRLALSTSFGYSKYHGDANNDDIIDTNAVMAELHTLVNRVNMVYQRDLGIRLEMIAAQTNLIATDVTSDLGAAVLADTTNYRNGLSPNNLMTENQGFIDFLVGSDNYDIGHHVSTGDYNNNNTFSQIGGVAISPSVCSNNVKAQGYTAVPQPENDLFYIDYVAHEIGHQFDASHTFNGSTSSCSNGNRDQSTAYEPGSGSTIMGYAGICGAENLQTNTDAYFHAASIAEITEYITNGSGASCGTISSIANQPPEVDAGSDFVIPANTPFILAGSATDNESDPLLYNWEQFDLGTESNSNNISLDTGYGPLFRSFLPTTSATRYLPKLDDVAAGTVSIGEVYPNTDRDLNFRLTARQNTVNSNNIQNTIETGGTGYDDVIVTVDAGSGPFRVTYPDAVQNWEPNDTRKICWDVTNTNNAPVSCPFVDVLLSTDGGQSFTGPILAANTANDGTTYITTPSLFSINSRIIVRCSNQTFFAMSDHSVRINSLAATTPIDNNHTCVQSNPTNTTNTTNSSNNNTGDLNPSSSTVTQTTTYASALDMRFLLLIFLCIILRYFRNARLRMSNNA